MLDKNNHEDVPKPVVDPYQPFWNLEEDDQDAPSPTVVGRRRFWTLAMKTIRSTAIVVVATAIMVGVGGAKWLEELGVFDVRTNRLAFIKNQKVADNSLVFDREGKKIGEFFNTYHVYVPFEELPKSLVRAILSIEDRNFFRHKGFDPKGIARAAMVHLKGQQYSQGASTITQQIVRHFLLPTEKSVQRKVQEIAYAHQLEKHLSKKKILELYANTMFLGNGSYGVGAAAMRYFGKPVQKLKAHEAALIAGLFQSPSRYNPARYPDRARARQKQVLKAMASTGFLSPKQAKKLIARKLKYKEYEPVNTLLAPHFIDYVREHAGQLLASKGIQVENQGLRIHTTLDANLQKIANESIKGADPLLDKARDMAPSIKDKKTGKRSQPTVEAALLTVDPRNGHVLAMVGGRDYEKSKYIRPVQALRSPGSAFKPIVFTMALLQKWKWSDVIFVSPITINSYRPKTPKDDYLTETTLLRAFYRSMNTPTVELGEKLGLKDIIELAGDMGIKSPIKEEFGTVLGSSDVTMMDLARMYGTYANSGTQVQPISITRIENRDGKVIYEADSVEIRSKKIIPPQISYLMTQGMRAVLSTGTGFKSGRLARWAAGKTGTANDSTDSWFCGYTPDMVSLVWVGTDEHVRMHHKTNGADTALPIWDNYMSAAIKSRPKNPPPFLRPRNVVSTTIHPKYGNRSPNGMRMWFIRGNEPAEEAQAMEALSHLEESTTGSYRNVFAH